MPIKYRLLQTFARNKQDPRKYLEAGFGKSEDFFLIKRNQLVLLQIKTERKLMQLIDFPDISPAKLI